MDERLAILEQAAAAAGSSAQTASLRGTRLADYRVTGCIDRRQVYAGVSAATFASSLAAEPSTRFTLTCVYSDTPQAGLGIGGGGFSAEYSYASGTRLPAHPCILAAQHSFIDEAAPVQLPGWEPPREFYGQPVRALFVVCSGEAATLRAVAARRRGQGRQPPLLSRAEAVAVAACVALALSHCERHGVVHRAVAPETIFVDESGGGWRVYLGGFAAALDARAECQGGKGAVLPYGSPQQVRGGPDQCLAPELLRVFPGRSSELDYRASDAWALGAALHGLLSGADCPFEPPVTHATDAAYRDVPELCGGFLRDLLRGLLRPQPDLRAGLVDAAAAAVAELACTTAVTEQRASLAAAAVARAQECESRLAEAEGDRAVAAAKCEALSQQLGDAQWRLSDQEWKDKEAAEVAERCKQAEERAAELAKTLGEREEQWARASGELSRDGSEQRERAERAEREAAELREALAAVTAQRDRLAIELEHARRTAVAPPPAAPAEAPPQQPPPPPGGPPQPPPPPAPPPGPPPGQPPPPASPPPPPPPQEAEAAGSSSSSSSSEAAAAAPRPSGPPPAAPPPDSDSAGSDAPAQPPQPPAAPPPKKSALGWSDSDSESAEGEKQPLRKPVPKAVPKTVPKKSAPAGGLFGDSSSSDSEAAPAAGKPKAQPASAKPAPKGHPATKAPLAAGNLFGDESSSGSDDMFAAPAPKPAAKKAPAKKSVPKKSGGALFEDSSSSSD